MVAGGKRAGRIIRNITSVRRRSTKRKLGILAFFNEAQKSSKVDNHSVENAPVVVQGDLHYTDVPAAVPVQPGGGDEITEIPVDEPACHTPTPSPTLSPAVDDETACAVDDEPACDVDDEPACDVDDETACAVDDEPACDVDDETACAVDDEPACDVDDEPACAVESDHDDHTPQKRKRTSTNSKCRQGFSKSWLAKFDWLTYNSVDNSMGCRLCHQQGCEGV